MTSNLSVDPDQLTSAISRLDSIASTLEKTLGSHKSALSVVPGGSDEVSVAAAKSFTASAEHFESEFTHGVGAIRDVAGALRDQLAALTAHDQGLAGDLKV
ncbi:PE family protein [Williamsia sp. CHRR-6]|uniref:PE family protein n=1 Tax=Williamsia sp. CHRR-6 TaxID=2835871 RepID=UPI001BD9849D|nr:PE family protein [Williamsia sp. CHRR-6]MBT0568575.1 PE family protein [Williamsia sp. CHRR-6]